MSGQPPGLNVCATGQSLYPKQHRGIPTPSDLISPRIMLTLYTLLGSRVLPSIHSRLLLTEPGYDFIPKVLDRDLIDTWIKVGDDASFEMTRKLIRVEGLLAGGSSGCAMAGAIDYLTNDEEGKKLAQTEGANVVVIMPDRWVSTCLDPATVTVPAAACGLLLLLFLGSAMFVFAVVMADRPAGSYGTSRSSFHHDS